jgi:hypothetical protein
MCGNEEQIDPVEKRNDAVAKGHAQREYLLIGEARNNARCVEDGG